MEKIEPQELLKITDFRIGNIVRFDDAEDGEPIDHCLFITGLFDDGTAYIVDWNKAGVGDIGVAQLKGVPLTEEWLVKMGFQYFKSNNSYQLETNLGFSFWGRIADGLFTSTNDNGTCNSEFGEPMIFIHEIQNRHYSLTKKELPITQ